MTEIDEAMLRVASGSHFIMGQEVKSLEAELAAYVGTKHCITCANGTDALQIALKVWGVGPGDAVFVPDFTFFSTAEVVSAEGATPIFVDVSRETFNISVPDLEKAIAEVSQAGLLKPKAIIAVDLFGLPADFAALKKTAERHGLYLLEDGAQGFGGAIDGKRACSFGHISTTSFFPAKPLGCYGDGGAIFTDNDLWAGLADSYRVHGKGHHKYQNVRIGMNSRLDTIQAAILQVKLKAFIRYELDAVNRAAMFYNELFASENIPAGTLALPSVPRGFTSSWAQYTVILSDTALRSSLQQTLSERDIPSMIYYPTPLSRQEAFAALDNRPCPVASRLCDTVLSLPVHPYITPDEQRTVVKAIAEHING